MIQDYYKKWKTLSNSNQFKQIVFKEFQLGENCGIVVKNFINKSCINALLSNYERVKAESKSGFNKLEGVTYPAPFSVLAHDNFNEKTLKKILPKGNQKLKHLLLNVEMNGENLVDYIFKFLNQGCKIKNIVKGELNGDLLQNESVHYLTIRELFSDQGGINKHNEKDLQLYYKRYFELLNIPAPHFQMSFFMMIQKPTTGGELEIHNQYFKTNHQHDPNDLIHKPKIDVGDLVIFNGGDNFHSVHNGLGDVTRITLGGFLSKQEDKFIMWS